MNLDDSEVGPAVDDRNSSVDKEYTCITQSDLSAVAAVPAATSSPIQTVKRKRKTTFLRKSNQVYKQPKHEDFMFKRSIRPSSPELSSATFDSTTSDYFASLSYSQPDSILSMSRSPSNMTPEELAGTGVEGEDTIESRLTRMETNATEQYEKLTELMKNSIELTNNIKL